MDATEPRASTQFQLVSPSSAEIRWSRVTDFVPENFWMEVASCALLLTQTAPERHWQNENRKLSYSGITKFLAAGGRGDVLHFGSFSGVTTENLGPYLLVRALPFKRSDLPFLFLQDPLLREKIQRLLDSRVPVIFSSHPSNFGGLLDGNHSQLLHALNQLLGPSEIVDLAMLVSPWMNRYVFDHEATHLKDLKDGTSHRMQRELLALAKADSVKERALVDIAVFISERRAYVAEWASLSAALSANANAEEITLDTNFVLGSQPRRQFILTERQKIPELLREYADRANKALLSLRSSQKSDYESALRIIRYYGPSTRIAALSLRAMLQEHF